MNTQYRTLLETVVQHTINYNLTGSQVSTVYTILESLNRKA